MTNTATNSRNRIEADLNGHYDATSAKAGLKGRARIRRSVFDG